MWQLRYSSEALTSSRSYRPWVQTTIMTIRMNSSAWTGSHTEESTMECACLCFYFEHATNKLVHGHGFILEHDLDCQVSWGAPMAHNLKIKESMSTMLAESRVSTRELRAVWRQMSTKHRSSETLSFEIFSAVSHGSGLYDMYHMVIPKPGQWGVWHVFAVLVEHAKSWAASHGEEPCWPWGRPAVMKIDEVNIYLEGNWIKKQAWKLKWEFGTLSWFFQIQSLSIANFTCLTFPSSWILIHW